MYDVRGTICGSLIHPDGEYLLLFTDNVIFKVCCMFLPFVSSPCRFSFVFQVDVKTNPGNVLRVSEAFPDDDEEISCKTIVEGSTYFPSTECYFATDAAFYRFNGDRFAIVDRTTTWARNEKRSFDGSFFEGSTVFFHEESTDNMHRVRVEPFEVLDVMQIASTSDLNSMAYDWVRRTLYLIWGSQSRIRNLSVVPIDMMYLDQNIAAASIIAIDHMVIYMLIGLRVFLYCFLDTWLCVLPCGCRCSSERLVCHI